MPKPTFFNLSDHKRGRVVDAAVDEFAERPYGQAAITRICAAADIAKGSFYQYFDDKLDLYRWLLLEHIGSSKVAYIRQASPGPGTGVFASMEHLSTLGLRWSLLNPKLTRAAQWAYQPSTDVGLQGLSAELQRMGVQNMGAFLAQAQAAGEVRSDLDAELAGGFAALVMQQGLDLVMRRRFGFDLFELSTRPEAAAAIDDDALQAAAHDLIDLLRNGLGSGVAGSGSLDIDALPHMPGAGEEHPVSASAAIALLAVLAAAPAAAQEVRGYAELRATGLFGVDGTPWQLVERFRPSFEAPLGERVHLSVTVEAALSQGRNDADELQRTLDDSSLGPVLDAAGCTWHDHDNGLFHTDDAGDYLSVERLAVDWYHKDFDLRIGRQALQWGSAMFVNPTDPFPEVLLTEPWRSRAGVNSARITVPIGDLHQIQGVVGTDDDFSAARLAARGTVNWLQTDFSLVGAWRQESDEVLAGVDIKGTAVVGFWLEGALRMQALSDEPVYSEQIAVGIDYSFPVAESLLVAGQYIRNGGGAEDASSGAAGLASLGGPECDDPSLLGTPVDPDPFAPFLTGSDYGLLSVSLAATSDLSMSTAWLQNLGDGSGLLIPTVSFRAPAQIDLSLSAQIPVATWDRGELKPADEDLLLVVSDDLAPVDFSGLVPDASIFFWTRFNL